RKELEHAPSAGQLLRQLQGADNVEPEPPPDFAEVDVAPADGKITQAELENYYHHQNVGPLQVEFSWRVGDGDVLTEALFRLLDRNHDGKLSRDELDALRQLDRNDDDLVSLDEIIPESFVPRIIFRPLPSAQAVPEDFAFHLVSPADAGRVIAAELLRRYDRDHDGRL